jgi:uncharacterized radical SAM superfamily Fe-S cluster-containing enzyme
MEILSYEEITTLAETAVAAGITRIRLTGGGPLIRRGVVELCRMLAEIDDLESLSLTTNGIRLKELSKPLSIHMSKWIFKPRCGAELRKGSSSNNLNQRSITNPVDII